VLTAPHVVSVREFDVLARFVDLVRGDEVPWKYGYGAWELLSDSLAALRLVDVRAAHAIADLGAGYGFPGVGLAIMMPETEVVLVELDPVRATFLRRCVTELELHNAEVVESRMEEWQERHGEFDIVTSRNVAALTTVLEWSAPLLRMGGFAVLWTAARNAQAELDGAAAAEATGLEPSGVRLAGGRRRYLHTYAKVRPTPAHFPRISRAARRDPIRADDAVARP
jgi:16S rRNA (guanine527-N7)-methyltransferase